MANDRQLDRENVAVKIIRKDAIRADRQQLINHFSWVIGVKQRQFVAVLDAGLTKQYLYYVREFLPASDVSFSEPIATMKFLVSAVDFLSRHGRVHGAIKPSNVFAGKDNLKLTDPRLPGFGSYVDEESIHFAAPEVLRGADVSHEADLYSLGAVAYRVLTGRHLFEDSDLSRLRAKYLSASAQSGSYIPAVSQSIFKLVLDLLSRDPAIRPLAFERLKHALSPESAVATTAPFVGRENVLKRAVEGLEIPTKSLRVVWLEGEIGIGKSRLVKEMKLYCAFHGLTFAVVYCKPDSNGFGPVIEGLHKLLNGALDPIQTRSRVDLEEFMAGVSERNYPLEKRINDVISLIGSCARRIPIVLALEDIDFAGGETVQFLQQLAFRGSEIPVILILTSKPSERRPEWSEIGGACLGPAFVRLSLSRLSEQESQSLVEYLDTNRGRQLAILRLSGGNPRFMMVYATDTTPIEVGFTPARDIADSILSSITDETRALLEVLSVFGKPISIRLLASLCQKGFAEVETQLEAIEHLGLIEREPETVQLRLPIVRVKLYSSLQKTLRRRLNRAAFFALQEIDADAESLSHHAFEAGMFVEAASLYRDLAASACKLQHYGTALTYFKRLEVCCKASRDVLTPVETLSLALCLGRSTEQRLSKRLYRELLSAEEVQADPDLLSRVYINLALTTDRISAMERSRLLDLATQCLPKDSSHFKMLTMVCTSFSRIGEVHRATEVLKWMEEHSIDDDKCRRVINAARGTLLMSMGDFRNARECLLMSIDADGFNRAAILSNLAFSFENSGDLQRALEYQSRSKAMAVAAGNTIIQILCTNNIAAIKTKCGAIREAEYLLHEARNSMRTINAGAEKDNLLLTLEADTAIHAVYRGDYALAADCIKNIRLSPRSILNIDHMLCEVIRCKVLIEIGQIKSVRQLLRRLSEQKIFSTDFFQVERALLEAQLPEIAATDRAEGLNRALKLSEDLGTLYQRCELLISLAAVHLELEERETAEDYIQKALELSVKQGYKLFEVRALLLSGLASEKPKDRQHFLSDAFQLASEIGLEELTAEAAYHIGVLNLDAGNTVTAREYLIRSTLITARLAEGVPLGARPKYLARKWRKEALRALDRCNESMPLHASALFNPDVDKYFSAAYRFTMAASAASSVELLLASIENTLTNAVSRSAVIVVKNGNGDASTIPIRIKLSPDLTQRIELIRSHARNRVFFETTEDRGKQPSGWIPINSETWDGGIYVAGRSHESHFTEREIELLTMMGSIASNALRRLETRNAAEEETFEQSEFHGIIGASKPARDLYAQIRMAAGNLATVLIEGESGTGKELVAKAIHAAGPRAKQPFIAVDCGAIPEGLIEAELFGAKRGSYTGAVADRPGLFEAAHRGTIFLDEISNTTPSLQAKLLRVIQEREVRRIGETKGRGIDVRLIVASNQNLEALAGAGQFRKDLLYRLRVLHLQLPPLSDRRDDIPMLAHSFLQKLNASNKTRKYFASGVIDHLCTQEFPGNVRELQNGIERGFFLAKGVMITDIPLETSTPGGAPLNEIQNWFKDISEGRTDFWAAIHNRYKRRDISREKVVALVDFGLRSTRGSYKTMASMFRLKEKDYRRFMDFLRRNQCLLDFRPYRKAAPPAREN